MTESKEHARRLAKQLIEAEPPNYKATKPILAYSIRSLGNVLSCLENEVMPSVLRAKIGSAYDNHKRLFRLLLLNLIAVGFSHEHLNIQTNPVKGSWINKKYGLDQRKTARLVGALKEHGLMRQTLTGNHIAKFTNAYRPTSRLLKEYAEFLYEPLGDFEDYGAIWLNGERFDGNLAWHPTLEHDRDVLHRYNEMMSGHTWARKDVTHRSFNDRPFAAGRVHTSFQAIVNRRIPIRRQTLMDGEEIVEPDFTANHLTLLSMLFDEHLPSNPYDMIEDKTRLPKAMVKAVFVRLMGCSTEGAWNNAQYSLAKEKGDTKVTRQQANEIRRAFYEYIPFLRKRNLLCTGWGGKLQFIEGETAIEMFEWAIANSTPILNVHDAFACKKQDEERVLKAMHSKRDKVLTEWGAKILTG